MKIKPGNILRVLNTKPLSGNVVAPPLVENKWYPCKRVILDSKGNLHIDVGLPSKYNFIRSHETGENLPDGDKIHWCHPSRFEIIEDKTNDAVQFLKEDSY